MKKEVKEAMKKSKALYGKITDLLVQEEPEIFEIVIACAVIITEACEDILIMPKKNFYNMLLRIIDFYTAKK